MKIRLLLKLFLFLVLIFLCETSNDKFRNEKSSKKLKNNNDRIESFNMSPKESQSALYTVIEVKGVSEIIHNVYSIFKSGLLDKSFLIAVIFFAIYELKVVFISAIFSHITTLSISISERLDYNARKWIDILAVLFFIMFGLIKVVKGHTKAFYDNKDKMLQIENDINRTIIEETVMDMNEITQLIKEKDMQTILETFKNSVIVFACLFLSETGDKTQFSTIFITTYSSKLFIFISFMSSHLILLIFSSALSAVINRILSRIQVLILSGAIFIYLGIICAHLIYINNYLLFNDSTEVLGGLNNNNNNKVNFIRKI